MRSVQARTPLHPSSFAPAVEHIAREPDCTGSIFKIPCIMSSNPYTVRLSCPTGVNNHGMTLRSERLWSETPSNVLFIVDPQNDFSDASYRRQAGSLPVQGATADYARIIDFLKNNDIQEVHVSLDTHSPRHIAHPGFWDIWNGECWEHATEANSIFRRLSIDVQGRIAGTSANDTWYFQPRRYGCSDLEYAALLNYVREYISFFYLPANLHLQKPTIWPYHCIEGQAGHRVAAELQEFLDRWVGGGEHTGPATKQRILRYHNKGRNNLSEMYSAFSADKPVTPTDFRLLQKFAYDGPGTPTLRHDSTGHKHYANHSTNVDTKLNVDLIEHLLRNHNHVYFCGEARTHCVKATLLDVMRVVEAKPALYNPENVELLHNMSSPIIAPDTPDDIAAIMFQNGFSVSEQ
jgi:nicotinamidase-related amidase